MRFACLHKLTEHGESCEYESYRSCSYRILNYFFFYRDLGKAHTVSL